MINIRFSSTVASETYTYSYDDWGRPTVTTHKLGTGSAVTLFSRAYDRAGRIASESRNDSTTALSRYMYGAKEWDSDLSLYDFSARYYTPGGAVSFTTMDPLAEKYYSISPYAYCAGNPVRFIDPSGKTYYVYDGNLRWLNDGKKETVTVSEEEFERLLGYFQKDNQSMYNLTRASYMEKYGYVDAEGNQILPAGEVVAERSSSVSFSQLIGLESIVFGGAGEYHYSEMFGKWRGRNGKRYDMSVNGNQYTGGKLKYARSLSRTLKRTGRMMGLVGIGSDIWQLNRAQSLDETIEFSLDLTIDVVGLSSNASWLPLLWTFGGKDFYYQFVIPSVESQLELGVLGLPASQPFK